MRGIKNWVALSGSAAGLVLGAMPALAQSSEPQDASESEILVVGRKTIEGLAATIKKKSDAIVDSLTAEQIRSTPDATLADALERVPGVSTEVGYNSSRARYATLRGFDARYNSTEIDGNLVWNSSRNNRGTQLDIFPAGVANEVNVYKTVLPDQDGNSIGGHIEMRSLRAFDGGDDTYVDMRASIGGYAQGERHSEAGGQGPSYRVSAVGKTTFGPDRQFGVVLGGEINRDVWYTRYNAVPDYAQIGGIDIPNGSLFTSVFDNQSTTKALYGKLEARRGDSLYAFVSAAYFQDEETDQFFRTGPFLKASGVTDAGVGTGSFKKVIDETYLQSYWVDRKTTLISSGLDYQVSDRGVLRLRGAYTNYDHYELDAAGEKWQFDNVSGSYDITDTAGHVVLLDQPAIGDPARWVYRNKATKEKYLPDNDKVYSLKLDFEQNAYRDARGLGFKGGIYFRRIDRNFDQTQDSYVLPKGVAFPLADVLVPGAKLDGVSTIFIDPDAYWAKLHGGTLTSDPSPTADYHLVEDVYAAHGALYYTLGRLRLLAGLRVEATRADDTTGQIEDGVVSSVTHHIRYTNVLPNAQAQFDLTPRLRLRASYTETLARPDFADFAMGQTITTDGNGYPVVKGTNPFLDPRTARNYDASLEYYGDGVFAALGLFRKDLDHETFVEKRETTDLSGIVVLTEQFPLNSGSASVQGLEAALDVRRLPLVPVELGRIGLSANYTLLDGKWNVVFSDGARRTVAGLRNQPHWLANVAIRYDKGPFGAKLAWRLQGRTFTGSFGTDAAGDIWVERNDRLDLKLDWRLDRRFELFASARNLTGSYKVKYTGVDDSISTAVTDGTSGFLGLRVTY